MKRKFLAEKVNHTYQRTVSGFNIFYDNSDYLVYYTIFSIMASRYDIIVYGLCLMIDHIHSLISTKTSLRLSGFMTNVTSVFVREYNRRHGRTGSLFPECFGSAPKVGFKLLRTAISYLYNNPVERFICRQAQDYRWNFLAFVQTDSPFSEPIVLRSSSRALRRALKVVDGKVSRKTYLTYNILDKIFSGLTESEREQLIDYIIVRYSVIRYDLLTECYGDYERMLTAINSNAGSEYEISESRYGHSDSEYDELIRYVRARGFKNAGDVISLGMDSKMTLMNDLFRETHATTLQICKFLHLKKRGT